MSSEAGCISNVPIRAPITAGQKKQMRNAGEDSISCGAPELHSRAPEPLICVSPNGQKVQWQKDKYHRQAEV